MVRSHGNHLSPTHLNPGESMSSSSHTSYWWCAGDPCVSPAPPEIHIQQVQGMESYEGLPLHKRLRMSDSWTS